MTYKSIEDRGVFLPVSECYCKFTSPARYDDRLVIEASLDEKIRGGVKFIYRIYREEAMEQLAEGYTIHPCVDQNGRVIRPPEFIREVIARHA
jgi:acyl-CoA thioester hydrolase